jgi:serine protease Do
MRSRPLLRHRHLLAAALLGLAVTLGLPWANAAGPTADAKAFERALAAVVGVRAQALDDARSAATLGHSRQGSGVVIGDDGLVLTIGYLVIEAETVTIDLDDGRSIPARVVAYDVATGFALVQALAPLAIAPARLGRAADLAPEEPLIVASGGDQGAASMVELAARRPFTGYWEYHIEGAVFTAPARGDHSGAGLFDSRATLVGIGSLVLRDLTPYGAGARRSGNMFVPVDLLQPILGELRRAGHSQASERAWLGINCVEDDGAVRIIRVAEDSPADVAGLQVGDRIVSLDAQPVTSLAALWKALWAGKVQREIALEVERDDKFDTLKVHSVDRAASLRRAEGI